MGTGYTRNDTPNNIADGNVINASDLDGEFDAIQSAFNGSTGHSHDGTTGEGPQIATAGLADNAVTTAKITDANVTLAKMAANSVDSDQYVDGSIDTVHIANDAVTLGTKTSGNYVAAGATSGTGISGSVSSEGGTFTVTSNATNANTAGTIVARDGSGNFSAGTITASLTGTASNANQLDSLDSTQFLRSDAADVKTSGQLQFSDNVLLTFGASNDLQIFHDGSNSRIDDAGSGRLIIRGNGGVSLEKYSGETLAIFNADGASSLYYDNSEKLITTNTGIDVTGTATMDGLTVSGDVTLGNGATLNIDDQDSILFGTYSGGTSGTLLQGGTSTDYFVRVAGKLRQNISTGGDISFYEDTGTTPKLFWDASAESLGINETSPSSTLVVGGNATTTVKPTVAITDTTSGATLSMRGQSPKIAFDVTASGVPKILMDNAGLEFKTGGLDAEGAVHVKIDTYGNVGIGTSSPNAKTEITTSSGENLRLTKTTGAYIGFHDGTVSRGAISGISGADGLQFTSGASGIDMTLDANGNVGIGTASPTQILDVVASSANIRVAESGGGDLRMNVTGSTGGVGTHSNHSLLFRQNSTEAMRIDTNRTIIIGETTTSAVINGTGVYINGGTSGSLYASATGTEHFFNRQETGKILSFRVGGVDKGSIGADSNGDIFIADSGVGLLMSGSGTIDIKPCNGSGAVTDNVADFGSSGTRFDDIYATNGTIQTSDQNEKNTITDSDLGIDFIKRLTPKSYIFNGKTRTHYGLIAQDVETVLGDISKPTSEFAGFIKTDISEEQDGSEYRYGLRYTEFVAPLIQAVKDQQATIDALTARITALENGE